MVIPNILWVTCIFSCFFAWVGFIDIRMLILTRVFCVLLYARVRLSGPVFETHLWSWSFAWRSSYLSSFLLFSWFQWCILILYLTVVFETSVVSCLTLLYIVASWTTILCFRCIIVILLCVCDSVIILFTVYAEFCQI